ALHMELLSRFEVETSSLPIKSLAFCRILPFTKTCVNAGFLLHNICLLSYREAGFRILSPQIHPTGQSEKPPCHTVKVQHRGVRCLCGSVRRRSGVPGRTAPTPWWG